MVKERVSIYIDGFNLYHALDALKMPDGSPANHLKWLNLHKLGKLLIKPKTQTLASVNYFSAYADFLKGTEKEGSVHRHRAYVAALEAKGVPLIEGNFARRKWFYSGGSRYRAQWRKHEEKQTDVAIGVRVVRDAYKDEFDTAFIVSCDADMIPVFELLRDEFPNKRAITVAPPNRPHHQSLIGIANDKLSIKRSQVEKALFGQRIVKNKAVVAYRPRAYDPPV